MGSLSSVILFLSFLHLFSTLVTLLKWVIC